MNRRSALRWACAFVATLFFLRAGVAGAGSEPQRYGVEIVAAYPHDPEAFTQGLYYDGGFLYESTGLNGRSSLRKVALETGKVLQEEDLPDELFGEGVAKWKNTIVGLTWRSGTGFVYDGESLKATRRFSYTGEGWGLASDGERLIMSDGTPSLRFLDPETLKETGRVAVTVHGNPLANLNELEWIDGAIFANIWQTDYIVRIDPESGVVTGIIDLSALHDALPPQKGPIDVLNGIAYDPKSERLWVTGKLWPKLFEIKLVPQD